MQDIELAALKHISEINYAADARLVNSEIYSITVTLGFYAFLVCFCVYPDIKNPLISKFAIFAILAIAESIIISLIMSAVSNGNNARKAMAADEAIERRIGFNYRNNGEGFYASKERYLLEIILVASGAFISTSIISVNAGLKSSALIYLLVLLGLTIIILGFINFFKELELVVSQGIARAPSKRSAQSLPAKGLAAGSPARRGYAKVPNR